MPKQDTDEQIKDCKEASTVTKESKLDVIEIEITVKSGGKKLRRNSEVQEILDKYNVKIKEDLETVKDLVFEQ